jgi:3-dehydroquinate synthase
MGLFRANENVTRFELSACSALMGHGLLVRLPELLAAKNLRPPFVVITDTGAGYFYGDAVAEALSAPEIRFPQGEAHKTLDTVRELYARCITNGLERDGTLLALGGGVVGDVAGFVAATFMRGVRWVNLPTTVLAMADASLGGKVGVDLPEGKNLVGAFHPPALVVADFDTLATLPEIEARYGLAEVIKAAIIGDADLFAWFSSLNDEKSTPTYPPIPVLIARAAAVKVGIVNADPHERGERAKLNLGHTIGHGVEAASGYAIRHGEAVAIGMVAEARLAEMMGLAEAGLAEMIADCLRRVGLPTHCPGLSAGAIRAAMGADKKKAGGKLKFALPEGIGEVVWGIEADEKLLMAVLEAVTDVE